MFIDGPIGRWDVEALLWLNGLVGRWGFLDGLMKLLVSDYLIPVTITLALLALWFAGRDEATRYRYQIGVFVALSTMGCTSWATQEVSQVAERARPFLDHDVDLQLFYPATDFSFPSNSVAAVFGIAAGVFGAHRKLGLAMFALGAMLGFARVYAGVHYPIDVVAGALIGPVIAILVYQFRKVIEPLPTWFIKTARIFHLA